MALELRIRLVAEGKEAVDRGDRGVGEPARLETRPGQHHHPGDLAVLGDQGRRARPVRAAADDDRRPARLIAIEEDLPVAARVPGLEVAQAHDHPALDAVGRLDVDRAAVVDAVEGLQAAGTGVVAAELQVVVGAVARAEHMEAHAGEHPLVAALALAADLALTGAVQIDDQEPLGRDRAIEDGELTAERLGRGRVGLIGPELDVGQGGRGPLDLRPRRSAAMLGRPASAAGEQRQQQHGPRSGAAPGTSDGAAHACARARGRSPGRCWQAALPPCRGGVDSRHRRELNHIDDRRLRSRRRAVYANRCR